jgi:hypothetical protein
MDSITVAGKSFSRIVCGTNAFYGRSHFSEARDAEYANRCSDGYIKDVIRKCVEYGVNAVESSANERIACLLSELRTEFQSDIRFVGSTRVDATSGMKSHPEKLTFLIEKRADICVIHAQVVDRPRRSAEIKGLRSLVARIHEAGLIAGISTHQVSTIEVCESEDYGIDTYLFPLNITGYVYPGYEGSESVSERIAIVQGTAKPFFLMKVLAAGRIPPDEGLQFALENSKPGDAITLGLSSIEEAEESLELATNYMRAGS